MAPERLEALLLISVESGSLRTLNYDDIVDRYAETNLLKKLLNPLLQLQVYNTFMAS